MGDLRYDTRKQQGLCVRCGACAPEEGRAVCGICREEVNARRKPALPRSLSAGRFNVCCAASGFHRVGCAEAPRT